MEEFELPITGYEGVYLDMSNVVALWGPPENSSPTPERIEERRESGFDESHVEQRAPHPHTLEE